MMDIADLPIVAILLFVGCVLALAALLLVLGNVCNPRRPGPVKRMPYESGMDPIHDTRRRFDVRFYLLAIAFLVFDVELLFLYPWAATAWPARVADAAPSGAAVGEVAPAATTPVMDEAAAALQASKAGQRLVDNRHPVFAGVMVFIALLTLGFIYDWRKGIFRWR